MKRFLMGLFYSVAGLVGLFFQIGISIPFVRELTEWSPAYGGMLWYVMFSPEWFNLKIPFTLCVAMLLGGTYLLFFKGRGTSTPPDSLSSSP